MSVRVRFVQDVIRSVAGRPHQYLTDNRHLHVRMGFQAKGQNGHAYEEHRQHAYHLENCSILLSRSVI